MAMRLCIVGAIPARQILFIVRETAPGVGEMKPHADFACNSKTCKTAKGATVYDLPVNATRCPVCGSKRIIRLFSAPNISRGIAKRSDAFVEPVYTEKRQQKDRAKEANRQAPPIAVDARQGLAAAVQQGMARAGYGHIPVPAPSGQLGPARPTTRITAPDLAGIVAAGAGRGPRPDAGTRRYTPSADEIAQARREA